jgi:hypothetical protein
LTVQIQKQKCSKELEKLIADLAPDLGKLQPKVTKIFAEGRKDGLTDHEIGFMVRTELKKHYSDRTIQRVLPETAKYQEYASKHKNKPDKLSGSEPKPIEIPPTKVSVEPIIKTEEHRPQQIDSQQPLRKSTVELSQPQPQPQLEPGPKKVKGRWNIAPKEYELEHLQEYDKELLIDIVKYLDKRPMGEDALYNKIHTLKRENAQLIEQLKKAEPFIELLALMSPEVKAKRLERLQGELAVLKERGLEL